MQITPEFNHAAAGPAGDAAAVNQGPQPLGPDPTMAGATTAMPEESQTNEERAAAQSSSYFTQHHTSASIREELESGTANRMTHRHSAHAGVHEAFNAEAARKELESLEAGRPKPAPHHRVNPPAQLKKIADNQAERQREVRISAIKAYLEFHQDEEIEQRHDQEHFEGLDLDF